MLATGCIVAVLIILVGSAQAQTGALPAARGEQDSTGAVNVGRVLPEIPKTLKARVISWDVGFNPATEKEWTRRVVTEVRDAAATEVDVLVFPELFSDGLRPYAPKNVRPAEFVTQRMRNSVLPSVKEVAKPGMLVALGTYSHQESGWNYALNRLRLAPSSPPSSTSRSRTLRPSEKPQRER